MKPTRTELKRIILITFILLAGLTAFTPQAQAEPELSKGQTVYVSVYSHIYSGLKGRPFDLAATLSLRNTDPQHSIAIVTVKFYDSDGNLVKNYLDAPLPLKPLESTRYILKEAEVGGGSGANFIVQWKAQTAVNPPIIESVMVGTKSGQGISFVSPGQVIQYTVDD